MSFNPHTTPRGGGLGRTRQWRAIERRSRPIRERDGIGSVLALLILSGLVLLALFALPV